MSTSQWKAWSDIAAALERLRADVDRLCALAESARVDAAEREELLERGYR